MDTSAYGSMGETVGQGAGLLSNWAKNWWEQRREKDRASTASQPAPDTNPAGEKLDYGGPETPPDRKEAETLFPRGVPDANHRSSLGDMAARVLGTPKQSVQETQAAAPQPETARRQEAPPLSGGEDRTWTRDDPGAIARGMRAVRQKDAGGSLGHSIGTIIKIIASMGMGAAGAAAGAGAAGGAAGGAGASGAAGASGVAGGAAPAASTAGGFSGMAEGGAGYTGMSDGGSAGGGMQGGMGGMSQMPSGGGGGGEGGMDMGKMQSMASDMMDKPAQNVEGINDMINAGKNAQRGAKFLMAEHLASTNGNRWGFPS